VPGQGKPESPKSHNKIGFMITFEELGIHPVHVDALKELGFEYPMPVQEKVIPLLLAGPIDIVALAQTGTGKTAAFGLPLIQMTDPNSKVPEALILAPTRELCMQIAGDLNDFAKNTDDLKILPVYGGSSMEVQIKALKKGVQIVVATPGRLCDLIRRKAIKLNEVKTVILDEAFFSRPQCRMKWLLSPGSICVIPLK
jgi:ATP-dependent RNA helicase DeaD